MDAQTNIPCPRGWSMDGFIPKPPVNPGEGDWVFFEGRTGFGWKRLIVGSSKKANPAAKLQTSQLKQVEPGDGIVRVFETWKFDATLMEWQWSQTNEFWL